MRRFIWPTLLLGAILTVFMAVGLACVPLPPPPTTTTTTTVAPLAYDLDCAGSTHGTVTLSDLDGVRIVNCHFDNNAFVQLHHVSHAVIDGNTFTADQSSPPCCQVLDSGGSNNRITNNTFDGDGDAVGCCFVGVDDGILLEDVTHDVVTGNTIDRVFDCGIETSGLTADTLIDSNTITHARTCGIGGWYDLNWQRNVVSNNTVTGSQVMFRFFWKQNLQTSGLFTDNQFVGNVSSAMLTTTQNSIFQTDGPISALNNLLTNNDFAHAEQFAPQFYPNLTAAFDGSGNLCGTRSQSGGSGPCP